MKIFMVLTFGFIFWGFYEVSGGADFEPLAKSPFIDDTAQPVTTAAVDVKEDAVLTSSASDTAVGSASSILVSATPAPAAPARVQATLQPAVQVAAVVEPVALQVPRQTIVATVPVTLDASQIKVKPVTFGANGADKEDKLDLHLVTGNRVNMRNGPSTRYGVVGRLIRDDRVEVLRIENGWAKLRSPEGSVGWMAAKFLRKIES